MSTIVRQFWRRRSAVEDKPKKTQNYADESPAVRGNRKSLHFWTWLKMKKLRGI